MKLRIERKSGITSFYDGSIRLYFIEIVKAISKEVNVDIEVYFTDGTDTGDYDFNLKLGEEKTEYNPNEIDHLSSFQTDEDNQEYCININLMSFEECEGFLVDLKNKIVVFNRSVLGGDFNKEIEF